MQILTVSGLRKTYTTRFGGSNVQALKNVNFTASPSSPANTSPSWARAAAAKRRY